MWMTKKRLYGFCLVLSASDFHIDNLFHEGYLTKCQTSVMKKLKGKGCWRNFFLWYFFFALWDACHVKSFRQERFKVEVTNCQLFPPTNIPLFHLQKWVLDSVRTEKSVSKPCCRTWYFERKTWLELWWQQKRIKHGGTTKPSCLI